MISRSVGTATTMHELTYPEWYIHIRMRIYYADGHSHRHAPDEETRAAEIVSRVGHLEAEGNPGTRRECVERLSIRPASASVRARSASEGSGTSVVTGPGPARCRVGTALW